MSRAAALVAIAVLVAGCGAQRQATTTRTVVHPTTTEPVAGLRIGLVGDVTVPKIAGAVYERGRLADVATDPLVLVRGGTPAAARVATAAAAHPSTHFAIVGGPSPDVRLDNVAGLVVRDDQAARLAGIVTG